MSGQPVLYSECLPFISQGGVYMAVGSPTGGPNDEVQDNVLFIIMTLQAKEIPLLDSMPAPGILRPACPGAVLSEWRQA